MMHITNLPYDLGVADVDVWIRSFKDFLLEMGLPSYGDSEIDTLTLEFSDEVETSPYNVKDLEAIKNEIRNSFPGIGGLDNILEPIETARELQERLPALADRISSETRSSFEEVLKKLHRIYGDGPLVKSHFGSVLAGKYVHSQKKIVLFNRVIRANILSGNDYKKEYEDVFAHELFHAYHYCQSLLCSWEIESRRDYTSTVVKESLASFFEKHYCDFKHIECNIEDDWRSNKVTSYPYSGAKEIGSYGHFSDIFNQSFRDMDMALRVLFYCDISTFYEIKNLRYSVRTAIRRSRSLRPRILSRISDADKDRLIAYFLTHHDGLEKTEEKILGKYGQHGHYAWDILRSAGVDNSKKGVLLYHSLSDEIDSAYGVYLETLIRLKAKGLI